MIVSASLRWPHPMQVHALTLTRCVDGLQSLRLMTALHGVCGASDDPHERYINKSIRCGISGMSAGGIG